MFQHQLVTEYSTTLDYLETEDERRKEEGGKEERNCQSIQQRGAHLSKNLKRQLFSSKVIVSQD